MRKNSFLMLFCLLFSIHGYCQDFQWVRQIKGLEDETETADFIEVDNNGNTYTLGKSNSIEYDIDPTLSGVQLINNQNSLVSNPEDIYLIKLNSNGDFVWGRTLSVVKDDESVLGLKFDSQGYIYVLAFITELYKNQTLIYGYGSLNVIKIDPNGNEVYRRKIKNQGNINAGKIYPISSFDIDSSDNIYITGVFQHTVLLDNNPQNNLVANGNSTYILKLNQSGDILWSKNLNFSLSGKIVLKIDSNDTINLLLNSYDNLNNGHLLNIIKLNNLNGNQIWRKSIGNAFLYDFSLDVSDNFVVIGKASNNDLVNLNPDPILSNTIQNKSFILFLDASGNYFDSKLFDINITFTAIEIDNSNNYHFGGSYTDIIGGYKTNTIFDFDPSSNNYVLSTTAFYDDGFYLKLDANRLFSQAFRLGSSPSTNKICYHGRVNAIKAVEENIFIAGDFGGDCDLDPSLVNSYLLNSFTGSTINLDGFILKIGNCDTLSPSGDNIQIFCSSVNPTIKNLTPNSSSIKWYDSIDSTLSLSNTIPLVDNKKYYASQKNGNCPESTDRLEITVHITSSPPTPPTLSPKYCFTDFATLADIAILGQNLKWYANLTDITTIPLTTLLQNGITYYVSQTINGCESGRTAIPVVIDFTELPIANSPQSFCIQQNFKLSNLSITGQNIKWYDALTNGNLLANTTLLQNGKTYYASQTIKGCESERTPITIVLQNTPAPSGNSNQSFCTSQNPTLSSITVVGTDIKWYDSSGLLLSNTTSLVNGTSYFATQSLKNCESSNKLVVTVSLITSLTSNNFEDSFCDDLNDGIKTINLSDYNSKIISNSINYNFTYYSSRNGAENQLTSDKINSFTNYKLPLGENKIYVRINSTTLCYAVSELKLTLFSQPLIPINNLIPLCENNSILISAGNDHSKYIWSTGQTSSSILVNTVDDYWVEVEDNNVTITCKNRNDFTVVLSKKAVITKIETVDWTDANNTITVYVTGNGDYEYSIDNIKFQDSNVFTNITSGQYFIYVDDKNGCGTAIEEVYMLMYPKFFTPNGDGLNDIWKINFSEKEQGLIIKIVDRYGKLIKELNYNSIGWDGTYIGEELPASDYWFVVTRANGQEYKGHFSLKR